MSDLQTQGSRRAPTAEERAKLMQSAMGAAAGYSAESKSSSFRAGGPTAEQRAQLAQMAMQQQHGGGSSGSHRPTAEDRMKLMQAAQGAGRVGGSWGRGCFCVAHFECCPLLFA